MSDSIGGVFVLLRLWLASMTGWQILSLLAGIGILLLALKVVKKGLSVALKILAVLLIVYFFAPNLVTQLLTAASGAPS